jgi:hypothetical protein
MRLLVVRLVGVEVDLFEELLLMMLELAHHDSLLGLCRGGNRKVVVYVWMWRLGRNRELEVWRVWSAWRVWRWSRESQKFPARMALARLP